MLPAVFCGAKDTLATVLPKIAQRFNAGLRSDLFNESRRGTKEMCAGSKFSHVRNVASFVPDGTRYFFIDVAQR
jgi:hypothetical protein